MFKFKNTQYSLEQLEDIAKQKGYSFDELLQKNPTIEEVGKTSPMTPGAVVDVAPAPDPDPTESKSGNGSSGRLEEIKKQLKFLEGPDGKMEFSDSPKRIKEHKSLVSEYNDIISQTTFDPDLKYTGVEPIEELDKGSEFQEEGAKLRQSFGGGIQPLELEEVEVTGVREELIRDFRIKSLAALTNQSEFTVKSSAAIAATISDIIGGTTEAIGNGLLRPVINTIFGIDYNPREGGIDTSGFDDFSNLMRKYTLKKYDDKGNEIDIYGLAEQGNYADAAELAFMEGLGSAPYLALAIANPVWGSSVIGFSVGGNEFKKALKERPYESIGRIYLGSILKGGVEVASNLVAGTLQRQLLGLASRGTKKQALKDFTDSYLKRLYKSLKSGGQGFAYEGGEEGFVAFSNDIIDTAVYKDKFEMESTIRNMFNSIATGGFIGGPTGFVGNIAKTGNKQDAYAFIAPKAWRIEQNNIEKQIVDARTNLDKAPPKRKKYFQNQIEVLELQKQNRKKELTKRFDSLTKKEREQYAGNIDIMDDAIAIYNNPKYTKMEQDAAKARMDKAAQENQNLIGDATFFNADVESSLYKVLKNSEIINDALLKSKNIEGVKIKNATQEEIINFNLANKDGAFDPKTNTVYINQIKAVETSQTNIIGHELLHYVMNNKFKTDNASMRPLVNSFKEYLKKTQPDIYNRVQQRIDENYTKTNTETGEKVIEDGALEDYFNVFTDLISKEKIEVDESFTDQIKNTATRFLNGLGFGSVKLEDGKDVFNFIRNYQKNISNFKFKQLGIDIKSSKIPAQVKEIVENENNKFSKSGASDRVQKIYEAQGAARALDIIDEFKPITNRIVNKYRNVPGFEEQMLRDEIETGKRGILDMIMDYTPEKAKGAPLAAYINTLLPKRAIEAANRILNTEFTLDVTEARGVTDTELNEDQQEAIEIADEIKSLRKEIGLPQELITKVKDAVVLTFGTRLPNPQDPKFRFELQKRFRTELKKPLNTFVGTKESYETFLRNNFEAIYDKLPQSLINRRFKEFAEPVLDKDGKQLRERTAEGKKIFVKKKIALAEFINYFLGRDVKRSTQGVRKTAIVEAIAEEMAFDATMEVLNDPDVILKYQDIADITGEVLPENFKALIAKQVDRSEDFKFSKSLIDDADVKYSLTQQELGRILFENNMIELANEFPELADSINDEAFKKSYPKVFYTIVVPAFEKAINKSIKEENVQQAEQVVVSFIKTFSRGTRTFSTKKGKLNLTANKALWQNVIYPAIKGKGLSSKKKFNLLKSGDRSYIRYADKPVITLIDVTSKGTRDNILSGKISKEEVNIQNGRALNELKNIIFNIGRMHSGLGASIIKVNQKDQRTLFRNAARLNRVVQNYKGDTVYEHNPPVQHVFDKIVDYFSNPNNNKKQKLINLLDTMEANLVPKDFAEIVDKKYKDKMPPKGVFRYAEAEAKTNYTFDEGEFKYSKSLNKGFNKILEQTKGVKWYQKFTPVEARLAARGKGRGSLFIPYSADDFVGLLYSTLSSGKLGNKQMQWYKDNLLRPFSKGIQRYEADKQMTLKRWADLKKEAKKDVPGGLRKTNETGFTNQTSLRMYMWALQGMEVPGISKKRLNDNLKIVRNNKKLKDFANKLIALNPEGYPEPSQNWDSGDITTDLVANLNDVKRSSYLTDWQNNVDEIFSEKNKTKLLALYGEQYVKALENILTRMKTGRNRTSQVDDITGRWTNWLNNSVGAIMFFNARSALLQQLSIVNFINFSDNNPINASLAFANQPQFWKDFSTLFNSDFLKQRRSGLQTDINADEIARAAETSTNKVRAAMSAILKFGFIPTQIGDSFAIASGGASFYRNRIKKYIKEGLSEQEAESKAFTDFQEVAEETQQSARPDRISSQQAGPLGRIILAFQNTPMQYARLTKKAALDLVNGRGDWKTNISKIAYYSVIQNIVFSALQQGLFALMFDDEEDEREKSRYFNLGNGVLDSFLRGTGIYGAAASTVKNVILETIKQSKLSRPDYTKAAIASTSISPPLNSKLRKLIQAGNTFKYKQEKEKVFTEGFSLDNPAFLAAGRIISATTNLPADRIVLKADHIKTAMEPETELWQSVALSLGWGEWELGMIEKETKGNLNTIKLNTKPLGKTKLKKIKLK